MLFWTIISMIQISNSHRLFENDKICFVEHHTDNFISPKNPSPVTVINAKPHKPESSVKQGKNLTSILYKQPFIWSGSRYLHHKYNSRSTYFKEEGPIQYWTSAQYYNNCDQWWKHVNIWPSPMVIAQLQLCIGDRP